MRLEKSKKLLSWGSKKKKSNRNGKVCSEFRSLRKTSRQIGKKLTKED